MSIPCFSQPYPLSSHRKRIMSWVSLVLLQLALTQISGCFDTSPPLELKSAVGLDYTSLSQLLKEENWQEANRETFRLMVKIAGKSGTEILKEEDLQNFPCQDLKIIDRLWLDYSNSKYGFTVQQKIWERVEGKPGEKWNMKIGEKFGEEVYWRRQGRWREYPELSFLEVESPPGHMPIVDGDEESWLVFGRGSITHWWIFSRLATCQL